MIEFNLHTSDLSWIVQLCWVTGSLSLEMNFLIFVVEEINLFQALPFLAYIFEVVPVMALNTNAILHCKFLKFPYKFWNEIICIIILLLLVAS